MRLLPIVSLALVCGFAGPAATAQTLRLAVSHGPVSLPVYVAAARGLFVREGLQLQMVECSSGRHCVQLMEQGKADIATAAELLVSLAALDRRDLAIVATMSASSAHIKLVARREAGLQRDPKAARGKRLATPSGTSAQYFLDNWLLVNGVDASEVKRVSLPPEQLVGALRRGDVDAIAIWEPLAGEALKALGDEAMVVAAPRIYKQHFSLVGERRTLAQREREVLALLRALDAASKAIRERPDDAKAVLMARLQVGRDFADAHWHEHDYRLVLEQSLVTTMDRQLRWAQGDRESSASAGLANPLGAIEPALLRRAVPGAVQLLP